MHDNCIEEVGECTVLKNEPRKKQQQKYDQLSWTHVMLIHFAL